MFKSLSKFRAGFSNSRYHPLVQHHGLSPVFLDVVDEQSVTKEQEAVLNWDNERSALMASLTEKENAAQECERRHAASLEQISALKASLDEKEKAVRDLENELSRLKVPLAEKDNSLDSFIVFLEQR